MEIRPEVKQTSVVIIDDHPVVRAGLTAMLSIEQDINVVGEGGTGREAVELFQRLRPDVMVVDLMLPDAHGSEIIKQVCAMSSNVQVIALTSAPGDEDVYLALEAGARAYLFKDMVRKELVCAVRTVREGRQYISTQVGTRLAESLPRSSLTSREVEVVRRIATGHRNKEIAFELNITEATVNAHVKHIMAKLKASDRTEAVIIALKRGIIRL
jgi:two-component system, NarL family, response regulator